jgi:hypothetical protein
MPRPRRHITRPKLELRPRRLRENLLVLLKKVASDETARAAFVRNPVDQVSNKIMRRKLSPQRVSEANRLLFALISDERMLRWLRTYESAGIGAASKLDFADQFARQVASLGDAAIIAALVGNAAVGNGIPGLTDVAYQCVCNETTKKTSTVCTPVAKASILEPGSIVTPEMLRVVSESLIARGRDLRAKGALTDLNTVIR